MACKRLTTMAAMRAASKRTADWTALFECRKELAWPKRG
jgi:hypothetical protein